jgi:hypothetical protein
MEKRRKMYRVLVGEPEGKIQLGRTKRRWEDGIRMGSEGDWLEGVWSGFTWLRLGIAGGLL